MSLLEGWIAQHPQDGAAKAMLAGQYTALKRYPEAKSLLAKLIEEAPNSGHLHNDYAWVLQQSGDSAGALTHASRANELSPGNPLIMDTLGVVLLARNETARAVEVLRSAAAAGDQPSVKYHYAQALHQAGDVAAARTVLTSLLATAAPFEERKEAEALLARIGK
jgi:Flp pilus assembly protein TadD